MRRDGGKVSCLEGEGWFLDEVCFKVDARIGILGTGRCFWSVEEVKMLVNFITDYC